MSLHQYSYENINDAYTVDPVAVTALILSLIAIIAPLIFQLVIKHKENEALKEALVQELLSNMDGLFNGGIERPFSFKVFEVFISKLSSKVRDKSEFQKILTLYADLKDFRAVTDRYWPPLRSGYSESEARNLCDEKKVRTINKFLLYFAEKSLEDKFDRNILEDSIEEAKEIRNKKQKAWHSKLEDNINKII